jgi:hypothetical protein
MRQGTRSDEPAGEHPQRIVDGLGQNVDIRHVFASDGRNVVDATKYGVVGGTLLAVGASIWNVAERASTAHDLIGKRGLAFGAILFLLESRP